MNTSRILPAPGLCHSIDSYFIYNIYNENTVTETYFPNGKTGIVFHFGDPLCFMNDNNRWVKMAKINFVSCVNFPVVLKLSGHTDTLAVILPPYSIYNMFGIKIDRSPSSIDATRYFPDELYENLSVYSSGEERTSILNDFFGLKMKNYIPENDTFKKICDLVIQKKGMISRQEISDIFNLSENYIHKLFIKKIGLSVKPFAQLIRISSILEEIYRERKKDFFDILYKYGYYDQAHFIKDFKKTTGKTPLRYFRYDTSLSSLLAGLS